jgi:hypothetical protein
MANDHYVPQFYLRNFQTRGKKSFVYSYVRGVQPKERPIARVASAKDFDRFISPQNANLKDSANDLLNIIETDAAPVINKLLTVTKFNLEKEEIIILAHFIAFLVNRTLWTKERLINMSKDLTMNMLRKYAINKNWLETTVKNIPELSTISEIELEEMRMAMIDWEKNFKIDLAGDVHDYYLDLRMKLATKLVPVILGKSWILLKPMAQKDVFITSDNPVVLLPPSQDLGNMAGGFRFSPVFLPLSPKRALLLENLLETEEILPMSKNKMQLLRNRIIGFAHKFVFSNILDTKIQQIFDTTKEGENTQGVIS